MEVRTEPKTNAVANAMRIEDRSAHDWYRFVLSFPPHLVREYVDRFGLGGGHRVLDPFCGTGTTLVECKKLGVPSVGIESNPAASFASRVKVRWNVDPRGLVRHASEMADAALSRLREEGIDDAANGPLFQAKRHAPLRRLPDDAADLLLANSISPRPLHKVLVLLDALNERRDDRFIDHERLALAKAMVYGISNLHFGPEVGVKPPKPDATVVAAWMNEVRAIAEDLGLLRESAGIESVVHQGDAREIGDLLPPRSVDAVITSPPYPNEKDYTRTTRLESVLLGFITCKTELRALKKRLVRSNTRSVYTSDRDDLLVAGNAEIQRIARDIEARRIEMGKTSGFERLYARVTKLYFGGMARHLADLRHVLRPGARLAYVVGDQASYLRVMIRTGHLLADIAASLGFEVEGIDLFRTRLATATKEQLREEVVVLRWPGDTL